MIHNKIYYALMQKINLNTRHPKNNFKCFTRLQAYLIKNLKIDNTYRKITNQKPSKLIKITSKMWLRMIYSSNILGHGISINLFELWISKQINRSKHSNAYQDEICVVSELMNIMNKNCICYFKCRSEKVKQITTKVYISGKFKVNKHLKNTNLEDCWTVKKISINNYMSRLFYS